jgi:hypothetical protein
MFAALQALLLQCIDSKLHVRSVIRVQVYISITCSAASSLLGGTLSLHTRDSSRSSCTVMHAAVCATQPIRCIVTAVLLLLPLLLPLLLLITITAVALAQSLSRMSSSSLAVLVPPAVRSAVYIANV